MSLCQEPNLPDMPLTPVLTCTERLVKLLSLVFCRELRRLRDEGESRFRKRLLLHNRYRMGNLLGKGGFSDVYLVCSSALPQRMLRALLSGRTLSLHILVCGLYGNQQACLYGHHRVLVHENFQSIEYVIMIISTGGGSGGMAGGGGEGAPAQPAVERAQARELCQACGADSAPCMHPALHAADDAL
jgi:serine/threonine protein kinase